MITYIVAGLDTGVRRHTNRRAGVPVRTEFWLKTVEELRRIDVPYTTTLSVMRSGTTGGGRCLWGSGCGRSSGAGCGGWIGLTITAEHSRP